MAEDRVESLSSSSPHLARVLSRAKDSTKATDYRSQMHAYLCVHFWWDKCIDGVAHLLRRISPFDTVRRSVRQVLLRFWPLARTATARAAWSR